MAKTLQDLRDHKRIGKPHAYDRQQAILYALGIGMGMDPLDERQLRFVLEDDLLVFPTFATVAAWDIEFLLELGIGWSKLIHLAQSMEIFYPFPPEAQLLSDRRILDAVEKPKQNATILTSEALVREAGTDRTLARLVKTTIARDFRVADAPTGGPRSHVNRPDREPDHVVTLKTSPQVALIYRQLGGRAKIHSTPADAREQGFEGPIMHGLSTWGHVCHVLLRAVADYDVNRLRQFSAGFAAPVYPGEELTTALWVDGNDVFFETRVAARDKLVLSDGKAVLSPA